MYKKLLKTFDCIFSRKVYSEKYDRVLNETIKMAKNYW